MQTYVRVAMKIFYVLKLKTIFQSHSSVCTLYFAVSEVGCVLKRVIFNFAQTIQSMSVSLLTKMLAFKEH